MVNKKKNIYVEDMIDNIDDEELDNSEELNTNEKYINELKSNREGLSELLNEITAIRKRIKDIMPDTKEFSKRFVLENRLKTITEIVKSELEIRKQIENSIKNEIDIKNKLNYEANDNNLSTRDLAIALEEMNKKPKLRKVE